MLLAFPGFRGTEDHTGKKRAGWGRKKRRSPSQFHSSFTQLSRERVQLWGQADMSPARSWSWAVRPLPTGAF